MTDHDRLHPNLAGAFDDVEPSEADDATTLDPLAQRLAAAPPEALVAPPPDLFARIEEELAADAPPAPDAVAPVVELEGRRDRRRWVLVGAAAAVIGLVVTGAVVLRDDPPDRQEIQLAALPGFETAVGSAVLEVDGDERSVTVELADVEVPAGSHLELWLLDPDVQELVSLGQITGAGPHQLPATVDLAATPIVDVSLEPDDGNRAHSGVSVARGELEPT